MDEADLQEERREAEDQLSRAEELNANQWDDQFLDVQKTALPLYDAEDHRGLSKTFRVSVILGSVVLMLLVILCLAVILPRSGRAAPALNSDGRADSYSPPLIVSACAASSYPDICISSLTSDAAASAAASADELVRTALSLAQRDNAAVYMSASGLLSFSIKGANPNLTAAARDCEYLLNLGATLFSRSVMFSAPIEDSQAWISGALTYQNDCRSALSYVNISQRVSQLMDHVMSSIILTSNALSFLGAYRMYGTNVATWKPPTRATVYGAAPAMPLVSIPAPVWRQPPAVTVALDGTGQFSSVQEAVNFAPDGLTKRWFVIYVRQGVYTENVRVPSSKTNLAFVGDGMGETVITGRLNAQMPGVTTYDSATVAVDGDGFLAVGVTFENTAGPQHHQAVALRVDSDLSTFYNCSFLGFQDTLYVHTFRQFYRNCHIEGTIDFVFGNAAAIFQGCTILFRPGNRGVGVSVVAAQGRTEPAEVTGLVFQDCVVDGTRAYLANGVHTRGYLGRPWKSYSRTVFLQSTLSGVVRPEGWLPWNGTFALSTLFYGEYEDEWRAGGGARVPWAGELTRDEAGFFTVSPFIQGDRWIPDTGVPFSASLKTAP